MEKTTEPPGPSSGSVATAVRTVVLIAAVP